MIQAPEAVDCINTGLCNGSIDQAGPGSGLMFIAIGFIALGVAGLWRQLKAERGPSASPGSSAIEEHRR